MEGSQQGQSFKYAHFVTYTNRSVIIFSGFERDDKSIWCLLSYIYIYVLLNRNCEARAFLPTASELFS